METPTQKDSTLTGPSKPVLEKQTSWRMLPFFLLGIVAGVGLASRVPCLTRIDVGERLAISPESPVTMAQGCRRCQTN